MDDFQAKFTPEVSFTVFMLPVISSKTHQLCQLQLSDTIVPTNYQMNPSYIEGISAIQGDFSLTIITWSPPILQSPWLPWGPTPGESRLWRAFHNCTLTELENIDNTFITEYKQSSPRSSGRYTIPYPVSGAPVSNDVLLPCRTKKRHSRLFKSISAACQSRRIFRSEPPPPSWKLTVRENWDE